MYVDMGRDALHTPRQVHAFLPVGQVHIGDGDAHPPAAPLNPLMASCMIFGGLKAQGNPQTFHLLTHHTWEARERMAHPHL